MTNEERNKIYEVYKDALSVYGIKNQALMLGEEQGELFKAVNKMIRFQEETQLEDVSQDSKRSLLYDGIVEEMADLVVMMEQIKLYYRITNKEISDMIDYKVNRLSERLENLRQKGLQN